MVIYLAFSFSMEAWIYEVGLPKLLKPAHIQPQGTWYRWLIHLKKKSKNTNHTPSTVKRMYVKRMYLHLLAAFIKFGHFNSFFLMIALYVITVRHNLYLFEVVHHYTHPSMSFLKSAEICLINNMIHKK